MFDVIIAGIGGRGILMAGRTLAEAAMSQYKYVSWFPHYGAAMRGGDSECTVVLSHEVIRSPLVSRPQAVIIMDVTQVKLFEDRVKPGGTVFWDSSVVSGKLNRDDVKVFYLPATRDAIALGRSQVTNFILLGAYLEESKALPLAVVEEALQKRLAGGRRASSLAANINALRHGAKLLAVYKSQV